MDNYPISSNSLEKFFYIDGNHFGQQYKDYLSSYKVWDQKGHAQQWLLFPENIGPRLSLDETSLSKGELYTILTNKAANGQKGTLVAIIEGTESASVIEVLKRIPQKVRELVVEVTLDMAGSMNKIVKRCFPKASFVIDRFHVQKLAYDAIQEMRIAHRWDAINEETNAIGNAKLNKQNMLPQPSVTAIPRNNFLPEACTCYSSQAKNGHRNKRREPKYYSISFQTKKSLLANSFIENDLFSHQVKGSRIHQIGQVVQ